MKLEKSSAEIPSSMIGFDSVPSSLASEVEGGIANMVDRGSECGANDEMSTLNKFDST